MKRFSNIVIVSDIDGTFLGKNSRMIPENVQAVKRFTSLGGKFTFVSRRTPVELKRMIPTVHELVNIPVGCCNGIHLCDINTFRILHDELVDKNAAYELLRYAADIPRRAFHILMVHGSDFYCLTQKEFAFVKDYPENCHIITLEQVKNTPLNKIVFIGSTSDIESNSQKALELFGNKLDCVRSLPIAREFIPKGKAKNVAIEQLRNNYSHSAIFAIGDYDNDVEMLKLADHSACPENALDNVKSLCEIHVCHHDDGAVAHLIRIIEEKYIG